MFFFSPSSIDLCFTLELEQKMEVPLLMRCIAIMVDGGSRGYFRSCWASVSSEGSHGGREIVGGGAE